MASDYGYIEKKELEALMAITFSDLKSEDDEPVEIYPTATVEAWITHAEELVIAYMRRTYTNISEENPLPTAVKYVVKEMAKIIAENQLIYDGYLENRHPIRPFLDQAMKDLLDTVFEEEKSTASVYTVESVEGGQRRSAY